MALGGGFLQPYSSRFRVLLHSISQVVSHSHGVLRWCKAILRRALIPLKGQRIILFHTDAILVQRTEQELRAQMLLVRRFLQPFGTFFFVFLQAFPRQHSQAQLKLRIRVSLLRPTLELFNDTILRLLSMSRPWDEQSGDGEKKNEALHGVKHTFLNLALQQTNESAARSKKICRPA